MYSFWKFFIVHNRFSFLLMVALAGFGFFAIASIPKESAPEVQIPVGIVSTVLPGAAAADIEALITNKIEQGLSGNLENVSSITSTSREGVSSVVVEFSASADIDESIRELKDTIDTITPELPENAEDPFVSEVNFVDQPIMTVAVSGDLSDAGFSALADDVEGELEKISGVSRVEVSGVRAREVTVIVDERALAQFGLTLSEVVSGLSRANTTFPIGSITSDGVEYNIAFEGDIDDTAAIPNIPIATRGGQPVYIRDIATIEDGYAESSTRTRLSLEGAPAEKSISFNVYKSRSGDITRIAAAVNARITEMQSEGKLLDGLTATAILDSGEEIQRDLVRLTMSGLQTVFLVVLLLVVAIGWREGLVAGTAIPLSFTIGFIGLYASGNTVNFVSLFALILAVGILVDSAIVIVEGINRRMKNDPSIDKRQAALDTVKEFNVPLMSGTLTTVAMFSGLFLVGGVSGQFISAIPFTINFVLFASLLVALGFIPLIASLFLRRRNMTRLEELQRKYSRILEEKYRTFLYNFLLNKKKKVVFVLSIIAGFFVAILLPVVGVVQVIFFDQEDIDWIYAEVEMSEATEIDETDIVARRTEEILYESPYIESFVTTVGASSNFAGAAGGSDGSKFANFFITLHRDRDKTSTEIVEELRGELSVIEDAEVSVGQPNNGPPSGTPVVIRFLGDDLDELTRIAIRAGEYLATIEGTTEVQTSTQNNSTEIVLELDRAKAARLGLDPLTISQTLRSALYGTEATSITTQSDDIDIVVKLALNRNYESAGETNEVTVDSLTNLLIALPNGETVSVGSIVDVSLRESSTVINHDDGERVITLSSSLAESGNARVVTSEFLANVRNEVSIPENVTISVGGENEESDEAFRDMFLSLIVGIVLMLAILVLQFNSFRHTLYVLSILPFSLIGIMVGLAITGKALSFPSLMGFIALSGIVVNNAILLIDQMNSHRRRNPDQRLIDSVVDAAESRLRPILLTTITTVIGIFPLTFASDLWSPLAWAIMFGLAFSVVITLVLVPIIYLNKPGKVG